MKLVLAPMEGLTDPLMRDLLTSVGHYDWCVSEFIRITDSVLPDHVFYHYCPELKQGGKTNSGTPLHVQFLGNDANRLAQNAARVAELGAPAIDLNFGCPAKTVNRHRGGAVLLDEPEVIYSLVKAVRDAVPAHIPVSAKMRLGYLDENNTLENAHAIANAGASWLTVHARTKADGYKPPAHWDKLPAIQQAIDIPVIANGEIWTLENATRCLKVSGCLDLMLGRGAVTRPDLVNQIRQNDATRQISWQDLVQLQLNFLAAHSKTEQGLIGRYKQWLGMLTQGYTEAATLWNDVKRIKDMDVLCDALRQQLDKPC